MLQETGKLKPFNTFIPYLINEIIEAKRFKDYENAFFKRVKEYNTLMKIDDYKFKEFKSYIKNREINVKVLNKDEIKSRKKKFIKDMKLLFNYNFPKDICTCKDDEKSLKAYWEIFNKYLEYFTESKLFFLKEYENEIQEKNNLTNEDSILFDTPRMIEGYIDFLKFLTRMIENDELSDKEKCKIASILRECIVDMSLIKIDDDYVLHGYYTEDAKRMDTLVNEGESFIDKYMNLINKYIKLSLYDQEKLKKGLETIEVHYVLF